ncbi:MAG: hypothetical protein QXS81_01380 [Candidatus Micrarchaeaceae archaeon]
MNLQQIEKEIQRLERERTRLEHLRDAKIELLKKQIGNIPARFAAEHPVVYATLKETKKAGSTIADYLQWAKEHPGKGWIQYLAQRKKNKELAYA